MRSLGRRHGWPEIDLGSAPGRRTGTRPGRGFKGSEATVAAYIVAGLAVATARPRSRHISAKVRRKVIERDLKGQKYDPKKHHIDHVWPYSRGGSSTEDNLRVLDKGENLKKGSKKPRIKDLF